MNTNIIIKHINYYLPDFVENNLDLQDEFPGKIDEALIQRMGIRSRHIAPKGTIASDLALIVGEQLFAETGFDKKDINVLVYCSGHRDYLAPSTSCLLQNKLGLNTNIATFDLIHACSGYVYSLALVKGLMESLRMGAVLLITSVLPSKYIHPKNPATRLVFGDAASATLITKSDTAGTGIGEFVFGTDGAAFEQIIVRDGWEASPIDEDSFTEQKDGFGNIYTDSSLYIDSQSNLLFIMKKIPVLIEETLAKNNLGKDDIDLYILHQSNYFALEQIRKKLKIEPERFFYSMENSGNTVQATIPIAMKEAMKAGKIKAGSKVLVAGFGAGLSWGATVLHF